MNHSVAKKLCVFGNCGGNYDPMLSKWYKAWTEMIGKAASVKKLNKKHKQTNKQTML